MQTNVKSMIKTHSMEILKHNYNIIIGLFVEVYLFIEWKFLKDKQMCNFEKPKWLHYIIENVLTSRVNRCIFNRFVERFVTKCTMAKNRLIVQYTKLDQRVPKFLYTR